MILYVCNFASLYGCKIWYITQYDGLVTYVACFRHGCQHPDVMNCQHPDVMNCQHPSVVMNCQHPDVMNCQHPSVVMNCQRPNVSTSKCDILLCCYVRVL